MNLGSVLWLALLACYVVVLLLLRSIRKDLKNAQKELEEAQVEIIKKDNELEVIKNVQENLKTNNGKKGPQKIESPASGDSDSRITRLNRMRDNGKD